MSRHPKTPRILKAAFLCLCLLASTSGLLVAGNAGISQAAPSPRASSPNGLLINEALDRQTPADEYFELYNTSNVSINLSTYTIYNRDGNTPLSGLDNPIIGPNEFRGISPTQLHTATIGGPTGLSQNDFLGLVNTSPSDAIIDVVNWGGAANLGWPNYDRFRTEFFTSNIPNMPSDDTRSLQRWPDGIDNNAGTDFAQIQRSPNAPSCADPNEGTGNDDALANAVAQELGTTVLHRLCPAGDRDNISLSLNSTFTYTLKTLIPTGSQASTVLRLYSPDNIVVAEDADTTTQDAFIRFRPSTPGTYKAQITDATGRGGAGAAWLYSFMAQAESSSSTATPTAPVVASCLDTYEPDDQLGLAQNITLNSEQTHTLCHPDGTRDTDWLAVQVSAGKVYTFLTKNLSGPTDTIISLHTADGTKLFENDDYDPGQGLASRIDYNFAQGGQYYLRIRNKTDLTGPGFQYTVAFTSSGQLPATGTPTPSATANPNTPTATAGACSDAYEPDGMPETAKLIYIGSTQKHSICPAVDADWVRFYARAGKVYTVRTGNLGVGLDTYMYLFSSDGKTILAQNDDGGEGVSSRIDFYPQKDDYYFVQVKNAGDIGGSDQTYDLSLAVAPGVPQPPGTATFVVAPVVTVTSGAESPTVVTQPTRPPVSSPTQGPIQPTPAAVEPTTPVQPPGPQPSTQPTIGRAGPSPTAQVIQQPTSIPPTQQPTSIPPTQAPVSGGTPTGPTPTTQVVIVPGVPPTGREPEVIVLPTRASTGKAPEVMVKPPVVEQLGTNLAPMLFRLFYDRNQNDGFDAGEGIHGINVYFVPKDTTKIALGTLTTSEVGSGKLMLPTSEQRIYIPYLGVNMPLTKFPDHELHSLWLPRVQLPSRVP